MQSRLHHQIIVILLFATGGCGGALVRVAPPGPGQATGPAPLIREVIDLGGLPIRERGELSDDHADGRFTPGEWVALVGEGLHASPRITVGGVQVKPAGYLEGGSILIRIPRGLTPGSHPVVVQTAAGQATTQLATSLFVVGADTQDDAVRIRRLAPGGLSIEDDELDIDFDRVRFTAFSSDGALLYAIQKPNTDTWGVPSKLNTLLKVTKKVRGGPVKCELLIVHLGARDKPRKVGSVPLTLSAPPTAMVTGPAGVLVILHGRELTLLDLSAPLKPSPVATLALAEKGSKAALVDAAFLADGRWLAVLEAYENRVHLVDLGDPRRPGRQPGIALSKAVAQPFSIDLAADRDGKSLWVLQGPNLRLAGKRLLGGLKGLWGDVKQLEFRQAAGTAAGAMKSGAMPPQESLCRVVKLVLQGEELEVAASIPLPADLFPFFIQPDGQGAVYVSGINRGAPDFSGLKPSLSGLKQLLGMLKGTAQLGRVLRVSAQDGGSEVILKGMAIYFDLALLPGGRLLVSTMRLGPGYVPPRLTLDWGLEIPGHSFAKLREVANSGLKISEAFKRLIPPYSYERISVQ